MFAYCGNNSINNSDKSGNRFFHFAYDIEAGSGTENDNEVLGATVSVGLTASFCITGWSYFGQISIATDIDGDTELQFTYGTAISTGDVGGSLMGNMAFLNVPDVKNLHGMGYQLGGTYGGAGLDFVIIPDAERDIAYSGLSFSGGYSTSDFHVSMGETFPIVTMDFNLLEFFDAVYKSYWGIYP